MLRVGLLRLRINCLSCGKASAVPQDRQKWKTVQMRELNMEKMDVSYHPAHCTSDSCSSSEYPTTENITGIAVQTPVQSLYTDAVAELVAIGAAIAANCDPCFKYHFQQASKLGISQEDMMLAVKTAQSVKETPAKAILQVAHRYLEGDPAGLPIVQSCCG